MTAGRRNPDSVTSQYEQIIHYLIDRRFVSLEYCCLHGVFSVICASAFWLKVAIGILNAPSKYCETLHNTRSVSVYTGETWVISEGTRSGIRTHKIEYQL